MGAAGGARVSALPERCAVDPRLQVPSLTYLNFSKSDLHCAAQVLCHVDDVEVLDLRQLQ